MIFHRSLLREFANLAVAVFLTLFLIAVTTRLIRLLGQAAGGKLPSDAVIAFLGFFSLTILPVLLSLTVFITVLLTLSRAWRDSEMVIWFNSGLAITAWMKPVLLFAGPLVVLIATMSLALTPWVVQMTEQYRSRIDARDDLSRIEPGAFGESRSREKVFFAESIAGDKSVVQNVFVSSSQHGRTGVMTSEKG
jgi:lipopolysaccharide export system permease protein